MDCTPVASALRFIDANRCVDEDQADLLIVAAVRDGSVRWPQRRTECCTTTIRDGAGRLGVGCDIDDSRAGRDAPADHCHGCGHDDVVRVQPGCVAVAIRLHTAITTGHRAADRNRSSADDLGRASTAAAIASCAPCAGPGTGADRNSSNHRNDGDDGNRRTATPSRRRALGAAGAGRGGTGNAAAHHDDAGTTAAATARVSISSRMRGLCRG